MAGYRSFIFPEAKVTEKSVILERRESHHLVRVLRACVGDEIELLDGHGRRFLGKIGRVDAKATLVHVDSVEKMPTPAVRVTLLQSMPKGKTMDLILRMATEIGASIVQPIYTDQSEVHLSGERMQSKLEKWQGTMIEACKQCGLVHLPEILPPVSLRDWLDAHSQGEELKIVASLEEGSRLLTRVLREVELPSGVVVAVGPEGDFTPKEYLAMRSAGFKAVRLGDNVLRAETASAYILSVIDQIFRDRAQTIS